MKKNFLSLLALVLAIGIFAFTPRFGTEEGLLCSQSLYYFSTTASNCSNVSAVNVIPRIDIDSDEDPLSDPSEIEFKSAAQSPYGCPSLNQIACAVGYERDQIETFDDNGVQKWRPKLGEVTNFKCCVKKQD